MSAAVRPCCAPCRGEVVPERKAPTSASGWPRAEPTWRAPGLHGGRGGGGGQPPRAPARPGEPGGLGAVLGRGPRGGVGPAAVGVWRARQRRSSAGLEEGEARRAQSGEKVRAGPAGGKVRAPAYPGPALWPLDASGPFPSPGWNGGPSRKRLSVEFDVALCRREWRSRPLYPRPQRGRWLRVALRQLRDGFGRGWRAGRWGRAVGAAALRAGLWGRPKPARTAWVSEVPRFQVEGGCRGPQAGLSPNVPFSVPLWATRSGARSSHCSLTVHLLHLGPVELSEAAVVGGSCRSARAVLHEHDLVKALAVLALIVYGVRQRSLSAHGLCRGSAHLTK